MPAVVFPAKQYLPVSASAARLAAKMAKIILSEFVEPELTAIWEFIAFDNLDAADRFLDAVQSTFVQLAKMPGMGRSRLFSPTALTDLRSFRIRDFDNYLVFYRSVPGGIEVFHVLHGARDLEAFFADE
jgi:toxin ParE1/3/4